MKQSQLNRKEKEDDEKDNPALSKVIERNIRTIIHLRTKAAHHRGLQGRIADAILPFREGWSSRTSTSPGLEYGYY